MRYGGLLEITCSVLLNIFFSGHLADSEGDLGDSDRELEEVKKLICENNSRLYILIFSCKSFPFPIKQGMFRIVNH